MRWFRTGTIKGYQAPTGTIIVTERRDNLERPAARLADYCAARGYQMVKEVRTGVSR